MSIYVLAALLSAAFHPFFPGFAKKAAHPLTLNFWGVCIAVLTFSFCYLEVAFWQKVQTHWILILSSGALHSIYTIAMLNLIRSHEFQVMYPLTRLAPILILIGEILFLEAHFSVMQMLGILSVISGTLIFGFDKKIKPVRTKIFLSIGAITLMATIFHLLDKQLVQYFSVAEMWAIVIFQIPMLAYILFTQPKAAIKDLKNWKNLLGYSIAMIGTWYFAVLALKGLDAAIVASLRNLSILFGILVGAKLFSEGHKSWRYLAAILIVIGVALAIS